MKAVVYSQCMRTAGNADKYVNTKLLINFYYFARTAFKSKSFDAACGGISVNSISGALLRTCKAFLLLSLAHIVPKRIQNVQ